MKKFLPIIGLVILLTLFVAPAASAAPPAWGGDCGGEHHCVRYGETLYSIGRMYNVDPYAIAHANGLYNPNYIYAGQVLYIPAGAPDYPWRAHHPSGCGGDCGYPGKHQPKPTPYYGHGGYDRGSGYDHTGYYYESYQPKYQRYGHTCGYYGNCY